MDALKHMSAEGAAATMMRNQERDEMKERAKEIARFKVARDRERRREVMRSEHVLEQKKEQGIEMEEAWIVEERERRRRKDFRKRLARIRERADEAADEVRQKQHRRASSFQRRPPGAGPPPGPVWIVNEETASRSC